ncbi:MAG TPA: hypothetical protein PKJ19_10045 [Flavobacteriales bacterium]|nr:hypothetical protein [Flavobacteriales bacterium]
MITLLAFGRRGYAYAASNMVASLRFHGYAGPIHLHVGRALLPYISDQTRKLCDIKDLADEYTQDPGWCKVNLHKIMDGKDTLYLDVDGICLKDVTPLMEALRKDGRSYITSVMGSGKADEKIDYFEWATPKRIQEKHGLEGATFYGLQGSWAYFKRGKWLDGFMFKVLKAWEQWTVKDLRNTWGKGKPDELFYSIACSQSEHDPSFEHPVFFGRGFDTLPVVRQKYYILSLYGVGRGRGSVPPRYVQCYDGECRTIGKKYQMSNAELIRRDKYANFKR